MKEWNEEVILVRTVASQWPERIITNVFFIHVSFLYRYSGIIPLTKHIYVLTLNCFYVKVWLLEKGSSSCMTWKGEAGKEDVILLKQLTQLILLVPPGAQGPQSYSFLKNNKQNKKQFPSC